MLPVIFTVNNPGRGVLDVVAGIMIEEQASLAVLVILQGKVLGMAPNLLMDIVMNVLFLS